MPTRTTRAMLWMLARMPQSTAALTGAKIRRRWHNGPGRPVIRGPIAYEWLTLPYDMGFPPLGVGNGVEWVEWVE
jgi:hypothetical protein